MDDSDPRKGKGEEAETPKKKAEDNPWYLLATLYGVPEPKDLKLFEKNRDIWNRCLATFLDVHERDSLVKNGRYTAAELYPCYPISREAELADAFKRRISNGAQSQVIVDFFPAMKTGKLPDIDFSNTEFDRDVCFDGYLFTVPVSFNKTRFSEFAGFQNATFFKSVQFIGASFKAAHFNSAYFCGAFFQSATFANRAVFRNATFSALGAHFEETEFRYADFSKANFFTGAYFNDLKMKGETSFEDATFEMAPPRFFGAELHEGTVWPLSKDWPTPKKKDEGKEFVRAYERLKLEMDRLKKHEDELNFFALELQSRRVLLGRWSLGGLAIALYGVISDYGRSYLRPLVWLFGLVALGAVLFRWPGALGFQKSIGLSAANTFNVFGFRKDFIDHSIISCLSPGLEVFAAVQTVLGTILLFLFGLGVRNKFRMK